MTNALITSHGIPALAAAMGFLGSVGVALNIDFKESEAEVADMLAGIRARLAELEASKPVK